MSRAWMFAGLVVLAMAGGATGGAVVSQHEGAPHRTVVVPHATVPAFPLPPDWHMLPTAPPAGLNTFCIHGVECFRVDGNGAPYGTPTWDGNASPGVRGDY